MVHASNKFIEGITKKSVDSQGCMNRPKS